MREEERPATEWGIDPSLNDVEALMWKAEASPRLRSARVVDDLLRIGPPTWVSDEGFDLGYHLRRVRAPEPGTFDEALTVAQSLAMSPLDRARPLWEAVLVEGLTDGRALELGGDLVRRPQPTVTSGVRFAGSLARVTGPPPADPSPLMTNRGLSRR